MGIQIFDRQLRTPVLTADGVALVEKARKLIADYDLMVPSIRDRDALRGEITIGVVSMALLGLVPAALIELRHRFPDLKVRVRPAETDTLLADLQRGVIDAAVLTRPARVPDAVICLPLTSERLHLVTSRNVAPEPPMAVLATQPFIRLSRTSFVGSLIEHWLQDMRITVNEVMELKNPETVLNMVSSDLGVSILPRPCVVSPTSAALNWIDLGLGAPERRMELGYMANTAKMPMMPTIYQVFEEIITQANADPEPLHQVG